MRLVFEPSSLPWRDTFQRINIDHVFLCSGCRMCWLTKDLYRNREGKHVCLHCNMDVTDVTESPLGQSFLQIVKG